MNAPSTTLEATQPRRHTLAFRLTSSERETINALARADGTSASEFARRAVFGARRDISSALDAAAQQGRDEIRPHITELEYELTEMRDLVQDSQRRATFLESRLAGAPDELLLAVRELLAGIPRTKERVARCWSLLAFSKRSEFLPTVAAVVSDEVDQSLDKVDVDAAGDLVDRLRWLKDALAIETSRGVYTSAREEPGRIPEPLEAVYFEASQLVSHRIQLHREYNEKRSAKAVVNASESEKPT